MAVDILTTERPAGTAPNTPRPGLRLWQFSLRGLLALVTLLGVGFGWVATKADHARRQRAAIEALGAKKFRYDFQQTPDCDAFGAVFWDEQAQPPGPALIRWLWGDYVFASIVELDLYASDESAKLGPGALRALTTLDTLEYLDLSFQPIDGRDLDVVRRLNCLRTLRLAYTEVSDVDLERLSGMARLEELDLSGTEISGTGLTHLKTCKRLHTLGLGNVPITQDGAKAIGDLAGLKSLDAGWFVSRTAPVYAPVAGDEILAGCTRLRHLESIDVGRRHVTDAGVRHLRGLLHIDRVDLSYNEITDAGVRHLCGLPRLTSLDLSYNEITDDGLAHLAKLRSLKSLELSRTKITDAGLLSLRDLDELKYLALRYDQITDRGVEQLQPLTQLYELHLSDTLVTDNCIDSLLKLPNLRGCCTDCTMVTADGQEFIKAELANRKDE